MTLDQRQPPSLARASLDIKFHPRHMCRLQHVGEKWQKHSLKLHLLAVRPDQCQSSTALNNVASEPDSATLAVAGISKQLNAMSLEIKKISV